MFISKVFQLLWGSFLVFCLLFALGGCATRPHDSADSTAAIRNPAQSGKTEDPVSLSAKEEEYRGPSRPTILRKDVDFGLEGLQGQCWILKGNQVRIKNEATDKTTAIPKTLKLRGISLSESVIEFMGKNYSRSQNTIKYDEKLAIKIVNKISEGDLTLLRPSRRDVGAEISALVEYPEVKLAAVGESSSGQRHLRLVFFQNRSGAQYGSDQLSVEEIQSLSAIVSTICH